jgi:hypothetical protein
MRFAACLVFTGVKLEYPWGHQFWRSTRRPPGGAYNFRLPPRDQGVQSRGRRVSFPQNAPPFADRIKIASSARTAQCRRSSARVA